MLTVRCINLELLMTEMGLQYALPQRNIVIRFTLMNRHWHGRRIDRTREVRISGREFTPQSRCDNARK